MLKDTDRRGVLRDVGCGEETDLDTLRVLPLIKKLETPFKAVASTLHPSGKNAGCDVHKQFVAAEGNQPLWHARIVCALCERGFEVAEAVARMAASLRQPKPTDGDKDESKSKARKVLHKFASKDTTEIGVWRQILLDHLDYMRATSTRVNVMHVMQGELDDVPGAVLQVLEDQNTEDALGIVDDCITAIVCEVIRVREERKRMSQQASAGKAEEDRERARSADRQRREEQHMSDEHRMAKVRAAAV